MKTLRVKYGHEVCNKYFEGDNTAKEAVDQWIDNILVQLITITVFYNPEVICIGGGISEEEWFINRIKDRYREECIRHTECDVITTKIDRCKYNNDANILRCNNKCQVKKVQLYIIRIEKLNQKM